MTLESAKQFRTELPVPMASRSDFNIWSVLKNCIGKELSKITMPVIFNEPLSFLQRIAEYMEYAHLLGVAAERTDPVERMQYVIAFAVSALASNRERLGKPFNPLLGETYELERPGFKLVCEQVSHHPPVSALYAEGASWRLHGSIHPRLRFCGNTVEIQPEGTLTLTLLESNETYVWSGVQCCVHNIISGKLWIEQRGTMEIRAYKGDSGAQPGHRARLHFRSGSTKDLHKVEGFIMDESKNKVRFIYGKWTDFLKSTDMVSYDDYVREHPNRFKKDGESKSPNDSPSHTPRKVLAKLNSLKVGPFKSMSTQESVDENTPMEVVEGEIPKSNSSYAIDIPHSEVIWQVNNRPENTTKFYQFTQFAMCLNEIEENMEKTLCPTDSRLRPDIRKLEMGDMEGAAAEKTRLEEKQRDACKSRKHKKAEDWTPRWFAQEMNPFTQQKDWLFTGNYWDRSFTNDINIF